MWDSMPSLRHVLLAALPCLSLAGGAVDAFRFAVPAFQVHTSREGLPQNTASALAHDREGRLWVATQDGLACWNGRAWRVHNLPDRQVSNFLRCLATGADGSIWAGRQDGGLARLRQGRWELVPPEQLGARRVDALLEVRGTLWAATPAGLLRQDAGRWTRVSAKPCRSLDAADGRLWVGFDRGLATLGEDGRFDPEAGRGLEGAAVNRVLRRRDGTLLAATEQGLYQHSGAAWSPLPLPVNRLVQGVSSITETEGHAGPILWVGTRDGLVVEEAGAWRILGSRDGLPGRYITSLLPEGRAVWIGVNEGVALHQPGLWRSFTETAGLPSPSVYCIGEAQGTLWMGCREGGLARLEPDGRWRVFTHKDGLPIDGVFSLQEHRGQLWAGTAGAGLARWTADGRWTQEGIPGEFRAGTVRRLEVDLQGSLWAVTGNRGLWRLTAAGWRAWSPPDGTLPTRHWHSLLDSGEHGLWIGSEGAGLLRIRQGRTTVFDRDHGFPNNTVLSLRMLLRGDGKPVLLAGTEGSGLLWTVLDGEPRWQTISDSSDPALPNNTIYQIQMDDQGRAYLFTNRGVARLTHGFGLESPARVDTFTTESGLPSNEFNGGASLRDSQGRIWGGTVAGAAGFDPALELPLEPLPPLALESATAAGRELLPGQELSYRDRPLRLEALLPVFLRSGETRYRSQIEGLEEQPGEWTSEGHREFPSLPSGRYVFKLWARDFQGRMAGPLAFPFRVKPAPWVTAWALSLSGIAGAGLMFLWVRWRLRTVTRNNLELEQRIRERTRTIEEQRDHIAQLMASTADSRVDLGAWVEGAVDDLVTSLGTGPIGVFVLEDREWSPLTRTHNLPAPLPPGARELDPEPAGNQPTLAVRGPSGDLQGALVLPKADMPEHDLGILRGFAAQLGAMLELQRTQEALRLSRIQRAQAHQAIAGRGSSMVQICPRCSRCFSAEVEACPEDGASLESPHLLPHCIMDRYVLQRLLGEGGMGLVFRARDLRLGRDVAVKVLKTDTTGPDGPARFRQEAQALAAIRHPGVVAIFDSGELEQGAAFLVTELLEGRSLHELLKAHGRGSFPQVATLLRQASAALGAAHGAGLLHRDLKPANLILVPSPGGFQAKLLDFGLAKSLRAGSDMTQAGKVIGTPNYMSPEQVRGLTLDARSDVWSFAALAFEALTGRRLVESTVIGEAFLTISRGRFSDPSTWIPHLPFAVDRAFQLGLHIEPAARPWDVEVWVNTFVKQLEATPDDIPGWPLADAASTPTEPDPPTRAMWTGDSDREAG